MEVGALRHLAEKRLERRRIAADRGEPARRRGFTAVRRLCAERGREQNDDERDELLHRTLVPGSGGVSKLTSIGLPPSGLAASTIPFDSTPISFAGLRLKTMTTVR